MASFHAKAEAQLSRKYGPAAWEWMPNWGKIRNRLSERNYQRHNQRMLILCSVVPAVIVSAVISALVAITR